jgi:hypothetical protein
MTIKKNGNKRLAHFGALSAFWILAFNTSCKSRVFNTQSDDAKQKAVTTVAVVDGEKLFQGIFVDELMNEESHSRYCAYFAETAVDYQKPGSPELTALDHFILAIEREDPEGTFVAIEPPDAVPLTPLKQTAFENTLDELENENGVGKGIFGAARYLLSNIRLAKTAIKEGFKTFETVMQVKSKVKRDLINVTSPERHERITTETRTIFSKNDFPDAKRLAQGEFQEFQHPAVRASNSGSRDLRTLQGHSTFEVFLTALARTPRDTIGVKSRCRTKLEMKELLTGIRGKIKD